MSQYNLPLSLPNVSELTTSDKAISVMYGRTGNGTLLPLLVDATGALVLSTATIVAMNSGASGGGSSVETLAVTGLLTTDTILAVVQTTPGANPAYVVGFANQLANSLDVIWNTDPGAGAIVRVVVSR